MEIEAYLGRLFFVSRLKCVAFSILRLKKRVKTCFFVEKLYFCKKIRTDDNR